MRRTVRNLALGLSAIVPIFAACSGARADLALSGAPTKNVSCVSGVCAATAATAILNTGDLMSMLATSDVTVKSGIIAGNIKVGSAISWASDHHLTIDSARGLRIGRAISVVGVGSLTILFNDGLTGGTLAFPTSGSISFWDLSSSFSLQGRSYILVNDLATLASDVTANPSGNFALAKDYDASANGTWTTSPVQTAFTGRFQGLGNTISHLQITAVTLLDTIGLFHQVSAGGAIQGVRLTTAVIKGTGISAVGGIAGVNLGTVAQCSVSGTVNGNNVLETGGIVGLNNGLVTQSGTNGRVLGSNVGGVVGVNNGSITDAYSNATVTGVAGLLAINLSPAGGLVGINNFGGQIFKSFATGAVSSVTLSTVGGLVGFNGGSIIDAYATGSAAAGTTSQVGGLAGSSSGQITESYSTGAVSAGLLSGVGGLVGTDSALLPSITSSYWNLTTSGVSNPSKGAGNKSNDAGITGLTDAQLKSAMPPGFNPTYWALNASINSGWPYLVDAPPT